MPERKPTCRECGQPIGQIHDRGCSLDRIAAIPGISGFSTVTAVDCDLPDYRPRIQPVEPTDYEPWLAEKIRRGEIDPPDEFVIEDREP